MTARKLKKDQDGFSLVEIMVVLMIIGLLTTFVVINVMPSQEKAMVQKSKADVRLLEQAVELYRLDMLDYPPAETGLNALVRLPEGAAGAARYRRGGYIKFLPNDPWDRPYIYVYPGEHSVYDIASFGSDGKPGGEALAADIVSWER